MSLIEHFESECKILGWPGDCEMQEQVVANVKELLRVFAGQGHSGSSAPYVIDLFKKAAMFEPLSPLTGEDSEWSEAFGDGLKQNKRFSLIFKHADGSAHWMNGRVFQGPDGHCYTNSQSRVEITFPWTPCKPEIVKVDDNGEVIK